VQTAMPMIAAASARTLAFERKLGIPIPALL
jgi:hypothetical protein